METFWQDLRYAARSLRKRAGFSAVVIITLAIGIGANTAIFSAVNSILLRPLAFGDPDRIVMVWMDNQRMKIAEDIHSYPNYVDYRDQNRTFEHLATYVGASLNLTGSGDPERVLGAAATANLIDVLRVDPYRGRFFGPEEEEEGKNRVVVISYALWQRRFGGSDDIIGQDINIGDIPRTVIGVMPPGFRYPHREADFLVPLVVNPQQRTLRGSFGYYVVGRLAPEASLAQAREDMGAIANALQSQYPNILDGYGVNVVPLQEQVVGTIKQPLLILLAAVFAVLLIACANVANLMLARGATRQREVALRSALGAGRFRIIRQLLTESIFLSVCGGVLGFVLAYLGLRALIAMAPRDIPRLDEIAIDWRVLLFTLGVSVLTGIIFGLAPALQSSKTDLTEALKDGGRTASAVHGRKLRSFLVVTEIGLSLILLISSGLLIKSFIKLQNLDLGFKGENIVTMNLQLSRSRYQGRQSQDFYKRLIERLEGVPGVEAAGATTAVFISTLANSSNFSIEGRSPTPANEQVEAPIDFVTPGYFRTMGIPLLKGRELTESDANVDQPVALINNTFAQQFWTGEDPIDKRFKFGQANDDGPWIRIVGIVDDMRRTGHEAAVRCEVFLPYTQRGFIGFMTVAVRTNSNPSAFIPVLRSAVAEIDSSLAISQVRTMDETLREMTAQRRLNTTLLGVLAVVALVLSFVGIYGVMSYSVAQQTHEIGVRVALGAQKRDVFSMVLKHGFVLAALGIVAGLIGGYFATRFLEEMLFQVGTRDPMIFVFVPIAMVIVATAACLVPARRATSVDPMIALRYE